MESVEFYIAQPSSQSLAVSFQPVAAAGEPIIAQYFEQDFVGDMGATLKGFYESGQLWALLIGLALGYGFKSLSSYG